MDARTWMIAALLGSALVPAAGHAQSSDDDRVRVIDGRVCRRDDSRPVLRSGPRWVCEDPKPRPEPAEPRERVRVRGTRR